MSQPPQARCAATGHGDHGDAVRRRRPDGQPTRYPSQGRGNQNCSLNSPPGSRSCHYRGLEQQRCYHPTLTCRARARDMSSRAGECLITWKCECPPRTRRRSIGASQNPSGPSVTAPNWPQLSRGRAGRPGTCRRPAGQRCGHPVSFSAMVLWSLVRLRRWGSGAAVNLLRRVACDQSKRRGGDEYQERDALRRCTEHGIDSARACAAAARAWQLLAPPR